MLVAFTFRAKPGKEKEFEGLLNNPDAARAVAKAMGATRNTLFLAGGRMVRVIEFPEGVRPRSLSEIAKTDPNVMAFLAKLGPLVEDGFDIGDPGSLEAFNRRITLPVAFDVRA